MWLQIHIYEKFSEILEKSVDDFYSKTISKVVCETPLTNISYDVRKN